MSLFMADFETSLINEEQKELKINEQEVYVFAASIMNTENLEYKLFANGKDTLKNFIEYITELSKEDKELIIGFHNLKYDWSYISYYLNVNGYYDKKELNSYSIDEVNDGIALYGAKIYYSYYNSGFEKTKYRDENGKIKTGDYKLDKDGNRIRKFKSYTINFIDTYKLFPMSVEKMGKAIGYPKGKDFDYEKVRGYDYKLTEEEKQYCYGDVYITTTYYNKAPDYMKVRFTGNKKQIKGITLASNALAYYKENCFPMTFINDEGKQEKFNKFEDLFPNEYQYKNACTFSRGKPSGKITMKDCNNYFKEYYFGGVTMVNPLYKGVMFINENFKLKKELVNVLSKEKRDYIITKARECIIDVNSLYPFIMRYGKLPYGTPLVIDYPSLEELNKISKNKCVFLEIENITGVLREEKLPIIPKNKCDKLGSSMLYKTILHGDSLGVFLEEFELINKHYELFNFEIKRAYIFKSATGKIFKEYVDKFTELKIHYAKKIDGKENPNYDECGRQNAKLMQNTLYGKFGMRIDKESVLKMFIDDAWITKKKETNEGKYIYPIISARITSLARVYMFSIIDQMPYEQFLYMDTDSIHFLESNKFNLNTLKLIDKIDSAKLGYFDNEDNTFCSIYLAPKKYAFYSEETGKLEIKCAGLPDDAKKEISTIAQFYYGYESKSKLQQKYIKGGIKLTSIQFRILKPNDNVLDLDNKIGV